MMDLFPKYPESVEYPILLLLLVIIFSVAVPIIYVEDWVIRWASAAVGAGTAWFLGILARREYLLHKELLRIKGLAS